MSLYVAYWRHSKHYLLWCYYGSHAVETVWPLLIIIIPLGWGVIVLPPHGQINEDHDEITIDERRLTIILIIQCYLTPCLPSFLLDHWMHKVTLLGHHCLALLIGHMHGHHELSSQRLHHQLLVLLRWHQLQIVLMHQVVKNQLFQQFAIAFHHPRLIQPQPTPTMTPLTIVKSHHHHHHRHIEMHK